MAQHKHIQLEKFSANEFLLNKMKVGDILALYFQENRPVNVIFENLNIQYSTENKKKNCLRNPPTTKKANTITRSKFTVIS